MSIEFQTIATGKDRGRTVMPDMEFRGSTGMTAGKAESAGGSVYVAQLDSSFFSSDVYADHARTTEDISEMAQNTDVWMQHNYKALLSNTLSDEDYQKAAEDGFDIKNTDSSETVTILDKIKSVLLEAGTKITGYNDDISPDKLAKITGSRSFAEELASEYRKNDIPITESSFKSAKIAYEEVSDIKQLEDTAIKYLVQNGMEPSIENIYFASHSTNGQNISGRGFYAQDTGGYYAQKADTYDWEQLSPQMDRIIDEAGLSSSKETADDEAKWLVKQGIPLTSDNLEKLHAINSIFFPVTEELGARAIAAAIADGKAAAKANLSDPRSNYEKAVEIKENTGKISDDGIRTTIQSGKELNLKNLIYESREDALDPYRVSECAIDLSDKRAVEARLQLEEIRLKMSVEANKSLLDRGFSIDTAPMDKLIESLKNVLGQIPDEITGNALDEISEVTPSTSNYLIKTTISRVNIISNGPISVSGFMMDELNSASLTKISDISKKLAARYEKAGEDYEALMTKPRADLGDNIKKAFRNVDDILEDMDISKSEDNRRAIRILGYNSMEITTENFEKVRSWDQMLKTTLERLKPGAVLNLIRDGKNPLGMTIEELAQSLDQQMTQGDNSENNNSKSDEKYSRFLYKLEHSGKITREERTSFIGIYRLFHNLKAGDYQAIGSVLRTGEDMTLGNLLKATRTKKASVSGMEYKVDDSFGGLTAGSSSSLKIDEQIGMAFRYYSAKADIVYENLEPEKLKEASPNESTLLPELADKLQDAGTDEELDKEYYSQQTRHIRDIVSSKDAENSLTELGQIGSEITFNNLEAMISNRRSRRTSGIWSDARDLLSDKISDEEKDLVDGLEKDDYETIYKESLDRISENLESLLMDDNDSYIDVRAISLMKKQLSVMQTAADSDTFDIPVEVDGQEISMHVTLKSEDGTDSRMEASIRTYEYGLISVRLQEKNGLISGMLTTTNGKSTGETEYLEGVRARMCDKLAEKLKEFGVRQDMIAILYHAQSQPISVGRANANATDGNFNKTTDAKDLLTMAKAFIEAL